MALYDKFVAGVIEIGLTEEEIKKWQYCGGDYSSHKNYFDLRFPKMAYPDHKQWCVCSHYIKKNAYICNETGDYNSIIVIGSCCIKRFMENGMHRTCETCGEIHRNSTVNKCNICRCLCCGIQVKKDGKCIQCKQKANIEKNYEKCSVCDTLKKIGIKCFECEKREPKKCECGKQIASIYTKCWTCNNAKKATCIGCNKKFDNKGKFTKCFECASSRTLMINVKNMIILIMEVKGEG